MLLLTTEWSKPQGLVSFGARFSSQAYFPNGEPMDMNFVSILLVGKTWHREAE